MEERLIQEIKDFFESYELAHQLMSDGKKYLSVNISTSKKGVVIIRVIEKISHRKENLMCDARIDGNRFSMTFRLKYPSKMINNKIGEIVLPHYNVTYLGTQLKIDILNPSIKDVKKTFIALEKFCIRREQ